MPALFDLVESEPEPGVRAALGHWLFGYVHLYPDGNGRMSRLMNAMLASGGYGSVRGDQRWSSLPRQLGCWRARRSGTFWMAGVGLNGCPLPAHGRNSDHPFHGRHLRAPGSAELC